MPSRPGVVRLDPGPDLGLVPYVAVDRVVYSNLAPWPTNANGTGFSLQRLNFAGYGNEPTNWVAAAPSAGGSGLVDSDGDGMPDVWEDAHGLNKLVNDAALAHEVAVPALQRVFGAGAVRVEPQMVAEDFPAFGQKAPCFYFLLGTRNDAKGIASVNHTATFDVDEDALPLGVRAMATLAWDFLARKR